MATKLIYNRTKKAAANPIKTFSKTGDLFIAIGEALDSSNPKSELTKLAKKHNMDLVDLEDAVKVYLSYDLEWENEKIKPVLKKCGFSNNGTESEEFKTFSAKEDEILNLVGILPIDKVHTPGELDKEKVLGIVPNDWYCFGCYFGYGSIARDISKEVKDSETDEVVVGTEKFREAKLYKAKYKGNDAYVIHASGASADYIVLCAELKVLKELCKDSINFYEKKWSKAASLKSKLSKFEKIAKEAGFTHIDYRPEYKYNSFEIILYPKKINDNQYAAKDLVPVVKELTGDDSAHEYIGDIVLRL